jgi:DNA-binding NarL/FixJ family response regulator
VREKGDFMTQQRQIRILTVDDHPLFREALEAVINSQPDMLVVAEAASGAEALQRFREHRPDVTLMDLRLPDSTGIEAMIAIHTHFPEARVILISTFEGDIDSQSAQQAGAGGHILKTMRPREVVSTIRQVFAGEEWVPPPRVDLIAGQVGDKVLTSREVEVLARMAGGNRIRDIGDRLFISEDAVKNHLKQIMLKLGARDRANALAIAARRGFIRL